ncbi:MAG: hypothetical protein ACI81S_001479 [Sphingobacteriales bacterium]|jgi:hypothetical protein
MSDILSEFKTLLNSRKEKAEIMGVVKSSPELFDLLVEFSTTLEQPYSWRAAWILGHIIEENDPRLAPLLPRFIDFLKVARTGHLRQTIIILQKYDLDEELEGFLFDNACSIWEDLSHMASVRGSVFVIIYKVAKKHPELKAEIELLTTPYYLDTISPGIKNGILRRLKSLK